MAEQYIMHRFDSIGAFVKKAEENAREGESSHKKTDTGWSGTKDFATAVRHARQGDWNPGELLEFRNMFDDVSTKIRKFTTTEFHRAADVAGFEVNMQAYLDGEPDDMYEWQPEEAVATKRALCVIIGHSIHAGNSAEELFIRGQAAIALVRALQTLGYELEIWSEETVAGHHGRNAKLPGKFTTLVRLHAAGEVMDESAVEYAIGNPSWLRRLLFGFQEGQPEDVRKKFGFGCGGYGSCMPIEHADTVGADVRLDLGTGWFGEQYRYRSGDGKATAVEGMNWVLQQLKALGVVDADAVFDDD